MADMCFYVGYMTIVAGDLIVSGGARCSPDSDEIPWETTVGWNDTPAQINSACQTAAIAAADVAGYTVGIGDNKTCLAGAVGLV